MEYGFPEITDSFLQGQDLLYTQFNDVNFYVEDIEQENFYFIILKKLFSDIKFDKIFPLGGKPNVIQESCNHIGDSKKVFIVDLDFDEILNKKINQDNLFYLDKYSIENYLIDINATKEIIKEERPKVKDTDIDTLFDMEIFLAEAKEMFSELIKYYLVIQKHELGIENVDSDTAKFCDFTKTPARLRQSSITSYHTKIAEKLELDAPHLEINHQLSTFDNFINSVKKMLINTPGKYILNFLKYRIEHIFSYPQISLESFTYRLAKNCSLESLEFLKTRISNYVALS